MKRIKSILKGLILNVCPGLYHLYVAFLLRKVFRDRYFNFQTKVSQILFPDTSPEVLSGPFVGMKYFNAVFFSLATSRWLGTYEMELHGVIEEVIAANYPQIFDIGCAEGYYVVGLAKRCPDSVIHARDGDPWSRSQCIRLCTLNGVRDRVKVGGLVTPEKLEKLLGPKTLVICDIEGFEAQLLDPIKCPGLKRSNIIVETHDEPGSSAIVDALINRFSESHQICRIFVKERSLDLVRRFFPSRTPPDLIEQSLVEGRPNHQIWLYMVLKPAGA